MPKASVSQETERKELESLPDGYVVLKKMSYGEIQRRRELAATMGRNRQDGDDVEVRLQFLAVQKYEFSKCIVEHNLEKDDNGTLFNFSNLADLAMLDPIVGQEIEVYIDEMNKLPGEETAKF